MLLGKNTLPLKFATVENPSQSNNEGLFADRNDYILETMIKHKISISLSLSLSSLANAYGRTLKKYHGWVVRGVFAVSSHLHIYTKCMISMFL